jgi:hypothetical protein
MTRTTIIPIAIPRQLFENLAIGGGSPHFGQAWTFLPLAAPTAAQTAAATKAVIRALANYADVVTAERATINVLADTIRLLLQR